MNERIAKLYIQAAEVAQSREPTDLIAAQIVQMQVFAQLIVQECLDLCLTQVGNGDYNRGRMDCHDNIREVFGMSVEDKKQLIKDLLGVSNDTKS